MYKVVKIIALVLPNNTIIDEIKSIVVNEGGQICDTQES